MFRSVYNIRSELFRNYFSYNFFKQYKKNVGNNRIILIGIHSKQFHNTPRNIEILERLTIEFELPGDLFLKSIRKTREMLWHTIVMHTIVFP